MNSRLLQDSRTWIYDIEVFGNLFCVYFKNVKTGNYRSFLVYRDTNMIHHLVNFLKSPTVGTLIGFNNYFYDDRILSYILENYKVLGTYSSDEFTRIMMLASNYIIDGNRQFRIRRTNLFKSVDIYRLMGFKRTNVSLKRCAVFLGLETIQDLPYPVGSMIETDAKYEVLRYNKLDVDVTEKVILKVEDEVLLREFMEEKYYTCFYNADHTYLGKIIFIDKFNNKVPEQYQISMSDLRKWKTPRTAISLNEVISNKIQFETPEFQKIRDDLYNTTAIVVDGKLRVVDAEKGFTKFNYKATIDNVSYTIGFGGIHDLGKKYVVERKKGEFLAEADASMYYPSWMEVENIVPEHFSEVAEQFTATISEMKEERMYFKYHSEPTVFTKLSDYALKIAINALFGLLGSKYFAFYDLKAVLQVTINGQLGLLRMIEKLKLCGIQAIGANTDGVNIYTCDTYELVVRRIAKEWEEELGIILEVSPYRKMINKDVNNYIWETPKGKLKFKGAFTPANKKRFEQSVNHTIVTDAANEFMLNGTSISHTINNCKNVDKFTITKRLGIEKSSGMHYKLWTVDDEEYPVAQQQKTTRFYISNNGHGLKRVGQNGSAYIVKNRKVTVYNTKVDRHFNDYDIDLNYYLEAANKLVSGYSTLKL